MTHMSVRHCPRALPAKQQFTVPLREAGYYLDFPPETEEIRKRTKFLFL